MDSPFIKQLNDKFFEASVAVAAMQEAARKLEEATVMIQVLLSQQVLGLSPDHDLQPHDKIEIGELYLNPREHKCVWQGNLIPLSTTEMRIVTLLSKYQGRIYDRPMIMDLCDMNEEVSDRSVDSMMKRIRNSFRKVDPKFNMIETVYGAGYRWRTTC